MYPQEKFYRGPGRIEFAKVPITNLIGYNITGESGVSTVKLKVRICLFNSLFIVFNAPILL